MIQTSFLINVFSNLQGRFWYTVHKHECSIISWKNIRIYFRGLATRQNISSLQKPVSRFLKYPWENYNIFLLNAKKYLTFSLQSDEASNLHKNLNGSIVQTGIVFPCSDTHFLLYFHFSLFWKKESFRRLWFCFWGDFYIVKYSGYRP